LTAIYNASESAHQQTEDDLRESEQRLQQRAGELQALLCTSMSLAAERHGRCYSRSSSRPWPSCTVPGA
jgi:hypothetical protein